MRNKESELTNKLVVLREKFLSHSQERISRLEQFARSVMEGEEDKNLQREAERDAHKIAGGAGTFGFPQSSVLARKIEEILQADEIEKQLLPLIDTLEELKESFDMPTTIPDIGSSSSLASTHVMFVSPNDEFSTKLVKELVQRGINAASANSLAKLEEKVRSRKPDIIILDLATGENKDDIHNMLDGSGMIKVVVGEALTFKERVLLIRKGVHSIIEYPVSTGEIIDVINKLTAKKHLPTATILSIDDDTSVLSALGLLMEKECYNFIGLNDPLTAWEVLSQSAPDVIILDYDMPEIDGIEICKVLKSSPKWEDVPVLFLTGSKEQDTIRRIFMAGADDYIEKPFVGPEITARITNRVKNIQLKRKLSNMDPVTGLLTKEAAEAEMRKALQFVKKHEVPAFLVLLKMDFLPEVSGNCNQETVNEAIQRVVSIVVNYQQDTDLITRWTDSELVTFLSGISKENVYNTVQQIMSKVSREKLFCPESMNLSVSASIVNASSTNTIESLYVAGKAALVEGKKRGSEQLSIAPVAVGDTGSTLYTDVVLVEDDHTLGSLLKHSLEAWGFSCHWIADGEEAEQALTSSPPAVQGKVILLDVDLPGLNGLDILAILEKKAVTRSSKVIMLTARSTEKEVIKALETGAHDHIGKPFSLPILLHRVKIALGS